MQDWLQQRQDQKLGVEEESLGTENTQEGQELVQREKSTLEAWWSYPRTGSQKTGL